MNCHKHLTRIGRKKPALALDKGQKIMKIAKEFCISKSTVYHELKRNTSHDEYLTTVMQEAYYRAIYAGQRKIFQITLPSARLVLNSILRPHITPGSVGQMRTQTAYCGRIFQNLMAFLFWQILAFKFK